MDAWPLLLREVCHVRLLYVSLIMRACIDDGEREILEFRLMGFSRDEILDELAESEQDRLELQASRRRLGRQFGRIRETLSAAGE